MDKLFNQLYAELGVLNGLSNQTLLSMAHVLKRRKTASNRSTMEKIKEELRMRLSQDDYDLVCRSLD